MTPDCGLTTTFRPGAVPTSARSALVTSPQRSFCETIDTRLASRAAVAMELRPNAPSAGEVPCPGVPGAVSAAAGAPAPPGCVRSEEHTSELQSRLHLVCRLL